MAANIFSLACLAIFFLATASALEDSFAEKMQKHIERLDAKIAQMEERHQLREAELATKIEHLETRVNSLEDKNEALTQTIYRYREKSRKHTRKQFLQKWKSDRKATSDIVCQDINTNQKKAVNKISRGNVQIRDVDAFTHKRALDSTMNVAFSAYLDHDENNLGAKETLVFNQVLLNEGNSYNKYTGSFTTPTSGVYSFTFFIGQKNTNQLWTALYVNDVNKVDAVAQTDGTYEDAQGGNSVLLKLAAGDTVYIRKLVAGTHVEGSSSARFTTFSGFLVYPTEDVASIIGK